MTPTDIGLWIAAIGTPVGGAIVWLWNEVRKSASDKAKTDIERERTYADRVEAKLREREIDVERLSKELMLARTADGMSPEEVMRALADNDPGISWVKKRISAFNYVMVRVSRGYAVSILHGAPEDYDDKRDNQIWPAELAAKFTSNDELVHTSQVGIHVIEQLTNGKFTGRKFPVHIAGNNYIVGIGSYEPTDNKT
jgi:hypothetical protein